MRKPSGPRKPRGPRKTRKLDLEKEQYWRKVFHEFQKSGLPFREYCRRENLSPNTFQYWRREIRERDEARGLTPAVKKGDNRPNSDEEKINTWLQIIDDANTFPGSLKEFCRTNSVASGSLYHWERRLKKLGMTAGLRKDSGKTLIPVTILEREPESTGPVKVASQGDEQKIEIRLHDGNRVLLPASLPAELVVHLLNGLRGKKQ